MSYATARSDARVKQIRFGPLLGRQLLPLVLVGLAFLLLRHRIPSLDPTAVIAIVQQVSPTQWGLAGLATLASFWAVGRYDQIIHRLMDTGIGPGQARNSGAAAIAIAQFAGFGVLSSALVRWRLLPNLTLASALRISLAVSLSFLAGWAVVTATVVLATSTEIQYLRQVALAVMGLAIMALAILIMRPKALPDLPTIRAVLSIVTLAFIDTLFAATALYILLPADVTIAPATLFTAYLVALGCGLIGGTPGGVGPFELALLALLPAIPNDTVLATALAFRIIYYVLPAGLAFLLLMRGPFTAQPGPEITSDPAPTSPYLSPALERVLWHSKRAEANLVRQGQFALLSGTSGPSALIATAGQSLIMLGNPVATSPYIAQVLRNLQRRAEQALRLPMVYKCGSRMALASRDLGWHILPTACEAWLNPKSFDTDARNHRQLRRLLRKASSAGVRTSEGGRRLPLDDMLRVSDRWASNHGGERSFSMGRFGRDYVSCQRVFLAYQNNDLIAFITLHEVQREWTLDLMRNLPDTPAGTMHQLVHHAIESAAALNCPRLSLAAVPCQNATEAAPLARIRRHLIKSRQTNGLRRFKASFDPYWSTLYSVAPSRIALALGLWAVYRRINCTDRDSPAPNS